MVRFLKESWLVVLMGAVFACLLAGTQTSLSEKIESNKRKTLDQAIAEVVPTVARSEELTVDDATVFKCFNEQDQLSGWAIKASGTGFIDKIHLVVGLDPAAEKITGMKVVENLETPGLGNKIEGDSWAGQYAEMDATRKLKVIKGKANPTRGEIAAITGATWSSKYVTDIVNHITQEIVPKLEKQ